MKRFALAFGIALSLSCSGPTDATGPQGWVAGFADYPADNEATFFLEADYQALPAPLDSSQGALYIAGTNRSDDLWMYF